MHTREEQMRAFARVLDVLDELREKCPWDRAQTNESLRENTIEETFELCDALLKGDNDAIRKELGDMLLHILFYAKIGSESGAFDIKDVCDALCDKLIYRHPHVFGSVEAEGAEQVLQNWELLKLKEKGGNRGILSGVPSALPSLIKAYRMQEKASHVGFDWTSAQGALDKVAEEIEEFKVEIERGDREASEEEMGDLLFSVINLSRLSGIHPDSALERTNRKFMNRFNYVEQQAGMQGRALKDMTLEEMDNLWSEAKQEGI